MARAIVSGRAFLLAGGCLSTGAAVLHIAIIFGGGDWYRFFGAGEQMAALAESGSMYPTVVTLVVAAVLLMWALYGFAGAGIAPRPPLVRWVLLVVATIYLARGVGGLILPWLVTHPVLAQNSLSFWFVSSGVCLIFGLCYLLGILQSWQRLRH